MRINVLHHKMKKYLKEVDQHRRDNVAQHIGVMEMIPVNVMNYSGKYLISKLKDKNNEINY